MCLRLPKTEAKRCRSSVVEHPLGKGEVVGSIPTGSTSISAIFGADLGFGVVPETERDANARHHLAPGWHRPSLLPPLPFAGLPRVILNAECEVPHTLAAKLCGIVGLPPARGPAREDVDASRREAKQVTSCYLDQPLVPRAIALPQMLAEVEAELAAASRPVVEVHLRQRAELLRWLVTTERLTDP